MSDSNPDLAVFDKLMIELRQVHKWYGEFHVLKDINLSVQKGERIVICGPSGSGKSTLIRCINRLEEHQRGRIVGDHRAVNRGERLHQGRVESGATHQVLNFHLFIGGVGKVFMSRAKTDGWNTMHSCNRNAIGAEGPETRFRL